MRRAIDPALLRIPSGAADHVADRPPLSVGIREACRLTGISRSKLYLLIAAGELETFKVGSRTLIAWSALEAFVAGCRRG